MIDVKKILIVLMISSLFLMTACSESNQAISGEAVAQQTSGTITLGPGDHVIKCPTPGAIANDLGLWIPGGGLIADSEIESSTGDFTITQNYIISAENFIHSGVTCTQGDKNQKTNFRHSCEYTNLESGIRYHATEWSSFDNLCSGTIPTPELDGCTCIV